MNDFKKGDRVVAMEYQYSGPNHEPVFEFAEIGTFIRRFKHPYRNPGYDDCASYIADERDCECGGPDNGYREIEFKYLKRYEPGDEDNLWDEAKLLETT